MVKIAFGVVHGDPRVTPSSELRKLIAVLKKRIADARMRGARTLGIELVPSLVRVVERGAVDGSLYYKTVGELLKAEPNLIQSPKYNPFIQAAAHARRLGMEVIPLDSAFSYTRSNKLFNRQEQLIRKRAAESRLRREEDRISTQIDDLWKKIEHVRGSAVEARMLSRIKRRSPDIVILGIDHHDAIKSKMPEYQNYSIE